MTSRGARLVLATAGLAFCAAALSWLAPSLPAGLAAACAPDLVLRELLAGMTVLVLLVGPSFLADEPARPAECHDGLLASLVAAPAAVALAAAGGIDPADLLPPAALLLACDLAASSYLRIDPSGRRGILFAASAAALLAGIPIAAYGLAEFGGWEGASAAFRASPLLAVRDVSGGWGAVGPAALVLVAAAAVLRFAGVLRKAPVAALALVVLAASDHATILVVGAPREGSYASLLDGLKAEGRSIREVDALPDPLPWQVEVVVLGRPARSPAEAAEWRRTLRPFAMAGGRVVDPDRRGAADIPAGFPVVVRHPADRAEPGVDAALFRIPFPSHPRHLPGKTLGFLGFLALAFAGSVLVLRRGGHGGVRSALVLGGMAAVGSSLLFLPGVLGEPFRVDRLVLEERIEGQPFARRVEILRVERLRYGGSDPVVGKGPGASYAEIRYAADAEPAWGPDGSVHLEKPGQYALLASVSGGESAASTGPWLAAAESKDGSPPAELAVWKRSTDERVARAGWLLSTCARKGGPGLRFAVPAEGPDALVIHSR